VCQSDKITIEAVEPGLDERSEREKKKRKKKN
jgi:hypothetical protein